MTKEADLLPCPFCGNAEPTIPEYERDWGGYSVWCFSCGVDGPVADTAAQAVVAWNRRMQQAEARAG